MSFGTHEFADRTFATDFGGHSTAVSSSLLFKWNTIGIVAGELDFSYLIKNSAENSLESQWNLLDGVSNNLNFIYDVKNFAKNKLKTIWKANLGVSTRLITAWDIYEPVNNNLQTLWDILDIKDVHKSLNISWSTKQKLTVIESTRLMWKKRRTDPVSRSLTSSWHVGTDISNGLTISYHVGDYNTIENNLLVLNEENKDLKL